MIIGISGKINSGKDLVGNIIKSRIEYYNNYNTWEIQKFAGNVKKVTSILYNIDLSLLENRDYKNGIYNSKIYNQEIQNKTIRELLQETGTKLRDILYPNIWIDSLFNTYTDNSNWIITDVRFKNELDFIKKHNGICIRLLRNDNINSNIHNHISETELDHNDNQFDITIDNRYTTIDELTDLIMQYLIKFNLINEKIK